jgi:C4-dicarboxylate-specific signal transduction histidine kinase
LLNLISNAKDALLTQEKEKKEITLSFYTQKEELIIKCCDSGDGVAKELQEKIFEPYFTTKSRNRGTGLGLYMSKQIIFTIFDGRLYVDTKRASCLVISIPFGKNCKLERE